VIALSVKPPIIPLRKGDGAFRGFVAEKIFAFPLFVSKPSFPREGCLLIPQLIIELFVDHIGANERDIKFIRGNG
jgi:hypothetical protein